MPTAIVEADSNKILQQAADILAAWEPLIKTDIPAMQDRFKQNRLELKLTGLQIRYHLVGEEGDEDDDPRAKP